MQSDTRYPPITDWLLLRGLACTVGHWGDFPRVMSEALDGARVHCLDLPGVGTEVKHTAPARVAGVVNELRQPGDATGTR